MWIGWIGQNYGDGVSYVVAIERKERGDCLLHVLLCDIPEEDRWSWRMQWRDVSGSGAWDRTFDNRVEGLFRYFYFKVNCKIIASFHGYECEYRNRKGPDDGVTWEGGDVESASER